MLPATKEFLTILFEKKEEEKPKPENNKEEPKPEDSSIQILNVEVTNKLSLGKPISDNSLANMKFRSNASKAEATEMLNDLGISAPSGKKWYNALNNLMNSAAGGTMNVFLQASSIKKSPNGKIGVLIPMKSIWKEDDKGGKRSFGFIRAVIMGARTAGFLKQVSSREIKDLRIEQIAGTDSLIAYVGKSQSWRKK
ncbi:MAG: hypothetical protein CBB97_24050 [Candidatus Endolissoclinum sp. TMED37]|nr:MAG: hypothetical protein CBB97_24050 [Candidatus Endolissoclinum sp. TMED37]